jgi:DNA-binding XRE family transcriptional regulator
MSVANRVRQAVNRLSLSLGRAVRRDKGESGELHTLEEIFPEAHPGMILRGFRGLEDMTQVDLAEKLGIHQALISEIENGKRPIPTTMAKKLAEIFGTSNWVFL